MSLFIIAVSIALTFSGCWFLNEKGSYTSSFKNKLIGYGLNLLALLASAYVFGNLRGLFVYIGLVSLVGMIFTLATYQHGKTDIE